MPGLLLLTAFLGAAIAMAGWRRPLAGSALLVLAAHLLEPQTTFVTSLAFLALGVAGAENEGVTVRWPALVLSVVLALSCWQVVAVGSWDLASPGATVDASLQSSGPPEPCFTLGRTHTP